jgi:hypothetical protein
MREHLGAVIATMKLSSDWHGFKTRLDKNYPRPRSADATLVRLCQGRGRRHGQGPIMKEAAN